ncbi:MAG: recombinase family protein [Flavobacteriaceae bacterium]|nr:recombinase family protein [Flavobacteriaceae bacterium]
MKHKKVGIWVRVSSQDSVDKDNALHHEIRAKSFVQARGWKLIKIYRLEAMSGKSIMSYPQTNKMMEDIRNGVISGLVFNKIARLARNTGELINIAKYFQEYNADLVSMDMSIDTSTPIGRHFYRSMSSIAELELELITDRVKASSLSRAKRGIHVGGVAPFGFTYENKILVPHKDEAPILKLMYELFLEYKRKRTVANILNERGYRTKKGNKFTDSTVRRLLQEPVAKGLHIMNRKDSKNKPKPKEEWCIHNIEAVVDETVWNQVNQIITSQKRTNTKPLNLKVHLFTGYVFCICGGRMYTRYNTPSYVCNKSCGNFIRKEDLEEVFKSELYSYAVSPQNVENYFERIKNLITTKEQELTILKRKKNKLNEKIEQLLELHVRGQIKTEAFHSYHAEPYEQVVQINQSIIELEGEILGFSTSKASTDTILQEAQNLYEKWETLNRDQKRSIIEIIVDKIIVGKDDIEINLYKLLPDGYIPSSLENGTNERHTSYSVMR